MSDVKANQPLVLFVVGPTATGKSEFAVDSIECYVGRGSRSFVPEIINCDSIQFFKGVDIGAAKPGPELLKRVRHHLIGHKEIGSTYTAGDFRRDALEVVARGHEEGHSQFVAVGGSGFYVQALEKGMYEVPRVADETRRSLQAEIEQPQGAERLYEEFRSRDPLAAQKVSIKDRYRILRALEILRSHPDGGTLTEIQSRFANQTTVAPFMVRKIGLSVHRERLRQRVEARTKAMLEHGLIDEVKHLRMAGWSDWAPLKSVGYREVQALLDGELAENQLFDAIVTSTMQLAKKQMTWFKRDSNIEWFDIEREEERCRGRFFELLDEVSA